MEPIAPIADTPKALPVKGTLADIIACALAAIAGLTALGYSVVFFTRFLENDAHLWGIVSAFLLCFGVGAFAYVPAVIIARIARRAHKSGATKRGLLWALGLLLPWLILSLTLVFVSDMPKIYSLPMLMTVALLMAWALISLRNIRAR